MAREGKEKQFLLDEDGRMAVTDACLFQLFDFNFNFDLYVVDTAPAGSNPLLIPSAPNAIIDTYILYPSIRLPWLSVPSCPVAIYR